MSSSSARASWWTAGRSRRLPTIFPQGSRTARSISSLSCLPLSRSCLKLQGGRGMQHKWIDAIGMVVVLALVETAWAQPTAPPGEPPRLTLQRAIQTALDKHPALQSATFAVQGAEARAKQAESPYYPQVGGAAFQTNGALRANSVLRFAGALIQPNQSDMTVGVVASQTVYDFGQTASRLDAQRFDKIRVEKDAMTRRAEVVLGVERAYFNVLKRKRLVEIAEHTVRERDVLKQQVETLYRNQLKSKLDLGLVQVQLSDAEFLVIRARNDLAAAFADLNNAMGVEGVVSVPLFTGFLIQNQVAEATAQQRETQAVYRTVTQNVQLEVKDSFLDVVTLIQQIRVAEQQVSIAREALSLAGQRYKLGLSSIVEVTQSEVAVTAAETRLAETRYDAKIAEARLRYAIGGI